MPKMSLFDEYTRFCQAHAFTPNPEQERLLHHLSPVLDALNKKSFPLFFRSKKVPSLYLWGPVGRGKSVLAQLFFDQIQKEKKKRVHFHDFMKDIHSRWHEFRHVTDPMEKIVSHFDFRYLFLDEFYVSDIADAMIVSPLLQEINRRGIFVLMTSNFEPAQLYRDGWQRDRFLPTISWIKSHYQIVSLDHNEDYRASLSELPTEKKRFFSPHTPTVDSFFQSHFPHQTQPGTLTISSRPVSYYRSYERVIWFRYHDICVTYRDLADYFWLSDHYDLFLISHIPSLTADLSSSVRRLTWLIDVLYERKKGLLMSSDGPLNQWSFNGLFADQFERTKSRLMAMQSDAYALESEDACDRN